MNFNQVDDVPLIIDAAAWAENEVGIEVVSLTGRRGSQILTHNLTLEFADRQVVPPNNLVKALLCPNRSDNSGSGIISENHRITCLASMTHPYG